MPNLRTCDFAPLCSRARRRKQRGVALLESLVAMLILAIGVLALASVQIRTLAETQTSVRRAQAIRAIEDLAERIKANPGGFNQLRTGSYASGWNADMATTGDGCSSKVCSPGELARSDLMQWKSNLAEMLPMGKASVFTSIDENADASNGRQIGVMVGWRANERAHVGADAFSAAFRVNAAGIECPEMLICHLVYVQP